MAAHPSLILNRHRALKLNTKLGKDVSTSPYKSKYMELKKRFFSDIFTVNFILPGGGVGGGVFYFGNFIFVHTFCNFRCVHYFWLPYKRL